MRDFFKRLWTKDKVRARLAPDLDDDDFLSDPTQISGTGYARKSLGSTDVEITPEMEQRMADYNYDGLSEDDK
jgi:hypothetical protein